MSIDSPSLINNLDCDERNSPKSVLLSDEKYEMCDISKVNNSQHNQVNTMKVDETDNLSLNIDSSVTSDLFADNVQLDVLNLSSEPFLDKYNSDKSIYNNCHNGTSEELDKFSQSVCLSQVKENGSTLSDSHNGDEHCCFGSNESSQINDVFANKISTISSEIIQLNETVFQPNHGGLNCEVDSSMKINSTLKENGHVVCNSSSTDEPSRTPFPLLPGELLHFSEKINEGTLYLTNYRLYVSPNIKMFNNPSSSVQQQELDQLINLPVNCIDSVEYRDLYFLVVFTKYIQSYNLSFLSADSANLWLKRLNDVQNIKIDDLFCFHFFNSLQTNDNRPDCELLSINNEEIKRNKDPQRFVEQEFSRMKFDSEQWKICDLNKDFKFCNSYPQYFIVPKNMTDKDLDSVANFRYSRRIPVVVWRSKTNGCVIVRSSQPVVGWLGWRSNQDERLLQGILQICHNDTQGFYETLQRHRLERKLSENSQSSTATSNSDTNSPTIGGVENNGDHLNGNQDDNSSSTANNISHTQNNTQTSSNSKLLILDARSYTAAFANRAMGGGCECPEYYANCEVQFMGLNNIHSIRKSFYALRYICEAVQIDQPNWFTLLDNTKWFHNLASLLKAAMVVVDTISVQERPVLVHCSDGWDRTPQVVALAELMLDPFYRTVEGFKVLIEREWLQFGHKFADRCRSSTLNIDLNERCPVFLQWLDCVHQLVKQFPSEFEFNVQFLIKLVYHSNSCLFGNFTCNTVQERTSYNIYKKTISIWSYFQFKKHEFFNYLYNPKQEILKPSIRVKDIILWNEVYVPVTNTNLTNIIHHNGLLVNDCQQKIFLNRNSVTDLDFDSNVKPNCLSDNNSLSQSKCDLTTRSASFENIANECFKVNHSMSEYEKMFKKSSLIPNGDSTNGGLCNKHRESSKSLLSLKSERGHEDLSLMDSQLDYSINGTMNSNKSFLSNNVFDIDAVTSKRICRLGLSCEPSEQHYYKHTHSNGVSKNEFIDTDCQPLPISNNRLYDIDGFLNQNGIDSRHQLKQLIDYHKQIIKRLTIKLNINKKIMTQ